MHGLAQRTAARSPSMEGEAGSAEDQHRDHRRPAEDSSEATTQPGTEDHPDERLTLLRAAVEGGLGGMVVVSRAGARLVPSPVAHNAHLALWELFAGAVHGLLGGVVVGAGPNLHPQILQEIAPPGGF